MDKKQVAAFERKVKNTIEDYELIEEGDKVLVACSGGKDSTTVLHLLHKFGYNVEALGIDIKIGEYSRQNMENVKRFCREQGIKLHLVDAEREVGYNIENVKCGIGRKSSSSSCTACGVIKRWILNKRAKELHADKLATGHNLNDESETVFMNLLKGNPELGLGMGQKSGRRKDSGFVQRIKPLYFCTNEETRAYSEAMGFPVIYEPCPCSVGVFRRKVRRELIELEKAFPDVRLNLVRNFLKLLPELRQKAGSAASINECDMCGEPSRNKRCRLCSLINIQKGGPEKGSC